MFISYKSPPNYNTKCTHIYISLTFITRSTHHEVYIIDSNLNCASKFAFKKRQILVRQMIMNNQLSFIYMHMWHINK